MNRRGFLAGSASLVAVLTALHSRRASGASRASRSVEGPYGPLRRSADLETGLPLILLPEGFEYRTFSWAGDPMTDGAPTPDQHDGMGAIARRAAATPRGDDRAQSRARRWQSDRLASRYDTSSGKTASCRAGHDDAPVPRQAVGSVEPSLGGTIYNCAGGATPWGTWLSCEETLIDLTTQGGRRHGYVFEVRAQAAETTAKPIIDMGRMKHEAVSIDPATKIAYLTEDKPGNSCFYRFIPKDASGMPGSYEAGGRLQAPRVIGRANADLRRPDAGRSCTPSNGWTSSIRTPVPAVVPSMKSRGGDTGSGPFLQATAAGGVRMAKARVCCHRAGKFYVVDSEAGVDRLAAPGHGDGAIWELDPAEGTLRAIFVAGRQLVADNIDNITVSPRGGILLCEDGDPVTDRYGPGTRLIGLTGEGDSYAFAKNNIRLGRKQLVTAGKHVPPNDYRGEEWAGACFDANGEVLFVNIQTPGITFAIWGPWERGNL